MSSQPIAGGASDIPTGAEELVRLAAFSRDVALALIGTDTLPDILSRCAELLVEHLDGAFARIWTLDPGAHVLELQASAGMYTDLHGSHSRIPVGRYEIGLIAQERQPHLTNSVGDDPRVNDQEWAKREGLVAFAGYPLMVEGHVIGVMAMFARRALALATLTAMESVAIVIALGIQRKAAESARRRTDEWARVAFASIGDGVITTDIEGRVTFLNGVGEELTGWRQHEAQGRPIEAIFNIIDEKTREPVENRVQKVLQHGRVVGLGNHTILIRRDSAIRPIDSSAAPIRGASGILHGVVLIFRDVTERRRAEDELRSSEARTSAILQTALDCVITMDAEGKVVEFNPAAERTFGFQKEDIIGQPLADFIIPLSLRERHCQGLAHYLSTGEGPVLGRRIEILALRADGSEFPVELAITPIFTDGPQLFTAYLRDLTEVKRREQHRNTRSAVTQALSEATSADAGVRAVLKAVCENLDWELASFWRCNPDGSAIEYLDSWQCDRVEANEFVSESAARSLKKGEGLPGRAWDCGNPVWSAIQELGRCCRADAA